MIPRGTAKLTRQQIADEMTRLKMTGSSSCCEPGAVPQPPAVPSADTLPPQGPAVQPNQSNDGTFPYDGGPASPVPMPKTDPGPQGTPNKSFAPGEGRLVSLPLVPAKPKYTYPAYGDNKLSGKK